MRDESGFAVFYGRQAPGLVRAVHAMTGDASEGQDCVQEAFAKAWQRWEVVSAYDAPEAWVRQVAWRLAVSRFRRARHGRDRLRGQRPPEPVPALSSDHVALVQGLGALPLAQCQAIVLHHLLGLSVEEVARDMSAPVGTVKARLSQGRAALAAQLAGPARSAL